MAEFSAVKILQDDFLTPFRDFARQAIQEIVESTPELRENNKWWADIEEYNKAHATGNIIDTAGRQPDVNNFDHNGAAKWLMRMYVEPDGVLLNERLMNGRSPVQIAGCHPRDYSSALAAYIDLRNNFLGHEGADAENMSLYDLLCHASLVIWLVDHLHCKARPAALQAMRSSRDNIAAQYDPQNPKQYTTPDAELRLMSHTLDWAHQRQEARRAAQTLRRDRNALDFEQWPIAEPMLIAPWEPVIPEQIIFPSELAKGRALPRTYTPCMPCPPTMTPQPEVEKAEPDYIQRKKLVQQQAAMAQAPDMRDDILYKILDKVTFLIALLYYALYLLFTFWMPRNNDKKWIWGNRHLMAYQQLLQGAIYDLRNGVDKPYTTYGLCIFLVACVIALLPIPFIIRLLSGFFNFLNIPLAILIFIRIFKRGKAGYKKFVETNVLEPGIATAAFIYVRTITGPLEKLFLVFALCLAFGFGAICPLLCSPGLACALGILIMLFGAKRVTTNDRS